MKYIKYFENIINSKNYLYNKDMLTISDVMKYLGVDTMLMDEESKLESRYNVDVIEFFKEIFMNKTIIFQDINRFNKDRTIKGKVNDVGVFSYKEAYIKVEILDPKEKEKNSKNIWFPIPQKYGDNNDDNWFLIHNNSFISIYDYDADTKPLHKEVKLKKEGEKYNL